MKHLPVHPTAVHPKTGRRIRALHIDRHGRPRYPILGASPDDPNVGDKDKQDPPKDDGDKDKQDPPKESEHGFPADTPVAEMTDKQAAAYYKHQSRKHEERARSYRSAAGGKDPDELKGIVTEAEEARRGKLTVDEKALEDARKEGERAILADLAPKAVESAFKLLLGDMPKAEIEAEIELLDLKKFLTEDNQVDTDKVKARVQKIRPDKGQQEKQRDFGQGRRGSGAPTGGVAAIMAERRAAREKK